MTSCPKNRAIFIDRDGTLIEEVNFLSRVDDLALFPFTDESLRLLKEKGYLIIIVTNQSGIGRGIYDEAVMYGIHDEIQQRLSTKVDAFYFCPHLPDEGCKCRKPGLGMIESARSDFDIDLAGSWMIGDKSLDVETGINAGMRTVMVLTGYGKIHSRSLTRNPDLVVENILEAALAITRNLS